MSLWLNNDYLQKYTCCLITITEMGMCNTPFIFTHIFEIIEKLKIGLGVWQACQLPWKLLFKEEDCFSPRNLET